MVNYTKYINSQEWKDKRLQRLEIDKYRCRLCDEDGTKFRLEVHHKPSAYVKIPNESVEDDLTTLCVRCHDCITDIQRKDRYDIVNIGELSINESQRKIPDVGIIKCIQFQPEDIEQSLRRIPKVV